VGAEVCINEGIGGYEKEMDDGELIMSSCRYSTVLRGTRFCGAPKRKDERN
jgi:hypothetical protein